LFIFTQNFINKEKTTEDRCKSTRGIKITQNELILATRKVFDEKFAAAEFAV